MSDRYYIREIEAVYKPCSKPRNGVPLERVSMPHDVVQAFDHLRQLPKEKLVAVLLDVKNNVLGYETVSIGSEDAALTKPTCAFRAAILTGATQVIFVHNHPSGDPTPSAEDQSIYRRLAEGGKLLGVAVLDFIVLGSGESFASFTELGLRPSMFSSLGVPA